MDDYIVSMIDSLRVRCPVDGCNTKVLKSQLHLHMQDPVYMIESCDVYRTVIRPFYIQVALAKFTVGEMNGTSKLIRSDTIATNYHQLLPTATTNYFFTDYH